MRDEGPGMRLDEFKDKPVMSIASGTKLGTVHDFLLDDSYLQIAALVVGGGGLFGGHKQAVAYSAVRGIGPDAVMVSGPDAVQEVEDTSPLGKAHAFDALQQQVMSESGVNLGRVVEMEFDPQTGSMTSLCFMPQGDTGPEEGEVCDVDRADIVSMTEKMVIVRHSVVQQTDQEPAPAPVQDRGQVVGQEPERTSVLAATAGEPSTAGGEPATAVARA
jgi:sporulation protein YlmC with PRC-barrel domain